jgi:hypothetical protein
MTFIQLIVFYKTPPPPPATKHTTCGIKIISHHKPWGILYLSQCIPTPRLTYWRKIKKKNQALNVTSQTDINFISSQSKVTHIYSPKNIIKYTKNRYRVVNTWKKESPMFCDVIFIQLFVCFLSPHLGSGIENTQWVRSKSYRITKHGKSCT